MFLLVLVCCEVSLIGVLLLEVMIVDGSLSVFEMLLLRVEFVIRYVMNFVMSSMMMIVMMM